MRTASARAAHRAMRRHDENFPLLFRLLPADQRADMAAVYAFCRATDDLGDEAAGDRLALLDAWEDDLRHALDGGLPDDPRLRALAVAVGRRRLDPDPFLRLVEANRMDQRRNRWETHEQLLHYCEHSATPVGHMVLGVLGYRDDWRRGLSDATCTGLQLVNFWQDIRRDLHDRDRIYLPREDMARFNVDEQMLHRSEAGPELRALVRFEVERTRALFRRGAPLAGVVGARARLDLALFTSAGLRLCDAIERQGFDTLRGRPAPGRAGRARLVAETILGVARSAAP